MLDIWTDINILKASIKQIFWSKYNLWQVEISPSAVPFWCLFLLIYTNNDTRSRFDRFWTQVMLLLRRGLQASNAMRSILCINTLRPRWYGQQWLSNIFSWMKMYTFQLGFHWRLLPMVQLTICWHGLRYWLVTGQVTIYYLNRCWYILLTQNIRHSASMS